MKLRVIITDANILIDLIKSGLSPVLFESGLFDIRTTDFVLEELWEDQKIELKTNIQIGQLQIIYSNEKDLIEIFKIRLQSKGLSIQDCSVYHFAFKLNAILLTGDGKLRKFSTQSGIEVHGILYLFDQLLNRGFISNSAAIEKLELLRSINQRLPEKEITERLSIWKKKRARGETSRD